MADRNAKTYWLFWLRVWGPFRLFDQLARVNFDCIAVVGVFRAEDGEFALHKSVKLQPY